MQLISLWKFKNNKFKFTDFFKSYLGKKLYNTKIKWYRPTKTAPGAIILAFFVLSCD